MEAKNGLVYSVRNVEDGQTVSLTGDGEFCIGLTLDEKIACSSRTSTTGQTKTVAASQQEETIAVPLMMLTVWRTSGVTVSPASRDLKCLLNGEDIGMEANIIPGNRIEVGDKVLELLDGTAAKTPRRHLPPTPGVPILPTPPPKPQRVSDNIKSATEVTKDAGRDALREWCLIELPNSERALLEQAKDPEQLASLAATYLTRHINVHTDVVMSTDLTDRIFKMMQEVAHHRRDILRKFLSEVINEVIEEDREKERDTKEKSHHATVTSLLVEILRQFLDPGYLVLLCLQLLRALSHIPGNVVTMVTSNTTAAVLGSMAAYKDDETVQNNCLDILAKMATFMPVVLEKPPMRESSIDLVAMAMTLHSKNLTVIQAGIRTLANLASSLHSLAFAAMIDSPYPELRAYVTVVIGVLDYLYQHMLPMVRDALGVFCADLTVKMDGRRFLFEYAKMDQLKRQQKLWEQAPDVPRRTVTNQSTEQANLSQVDGEVLDRSDDEESFNSKEENDSASSGTSGILKKSRSFENLRRQERQVFFKDEDEESSSSSSGTSSPVNHPGQTDRSESPDIQVLSRSRIYPSSLPSGDSTDGEVPQSPTVINGHNTYSDSPPAKPSRRPIGAPLVHVNSQSDSDIDSYTEGPSNTNMAISSHNHNSADINESVDKLPVNNICILPASENGGDLYSPEHQSSFPSSPPPVSQSATNPVDLTDFRYTAADIMFMKRLMCVQVTCHVCSASVRGSDPPALKLLDMPLNHLLSRPGIPNAIWQFANSQYEEDATLMDIDPATVISAIDAVRYKSLAFEVVQKSLQSMVQTMGPKLHAKMFAIAGEVTHSVFRDTTLSPIIADREFVSSLESGLVKVKSSMSDPMPVTALIDSLHLMVKSKSKQPGGQP